MAVKRFLSTENQAFDKKTHKQKDVSIYGSSHVR
jgi:hypothetical protein